MKLTKHDSVERLLTKFEDFLTFSLLLKWPYKESNILEIHNYMGVFTYLILNIGGNGHIPLTYMQI